MSSIVRGYRTQEDGEKVIAQTQNIKKELIKENDSHKKNKRRLIISTLVDLWQD